MISKLKLTSFLISFVICLSMLVFIITPLTRVELAINLFLGVIGVVVFTLKYNYFEKLFRDWLMAFIGLGILSIFTNVYFLKVSFVSGFIGSIAYFKLLALAPLYLWIKNKYYFDKTIYYLKIFGIVTFLVHLIIFVFDIQILFHGGASDTVLEIGSSKLNKMLVNFMACLLLGYFFLERKNKYLIYSIVFFSANMFGDFQRWVFICYTATIFFGFFIQNSLSLRLRLLPLSIVLIVASYLTINYTSVGDLVSYKLDNVFALFSETRLVKDSSINVRLIQAEIAFNSFKESPIIGNGVFRNSVKDDVFNDEYFHLSDIGLLGLLFSFGIVGIMAFVFQIKTCLAMKKSSAIEMGLKLFMIFLLFFSILTASSILQPSVFMVVVLLYSKSKHINNLSTIEKS